MAKITLSHFLKQLLFLWTTLQLTYAQLQNETDGASNITDDASNITVADEVPSYVVKSPGQEVCTPNSTSGAGLWCYECKQSFSKTYDPENTICWNNLSQIALRQCGPRDNYCKVERMDLHGQVMTIERGCVEECYYGCRFNGYGLMQMRCTSCCRTPCCNDDNSATPTQTSASICMLSLLSTLLFWR